MLKLSSQWRNEALVRRGLAYGIFLLCAYTAWMRAGVYPSLQWPMAILAFLLCAIVFILPAEQRQKIRSRVSRDPMFYVGSFFLLLLIIQWTNSGYGVASDGSGSAAMVRVPSKWFPWSVDRTDAAEMLLWFIPAFTLMLLVRNILSRTNIKMLVQLLVWNSALLACAGILQHMLGQDKILGIWNAPRSDFFATFDYPNHAAAWFYLHATLAAGLAHDAEVKRKPRIRVAVFFGCFLCCIAACCLTLSRFGAFVALIQFSAVFILLLYHTRKYLRGQKAFNAYLAMGIIALVGMTLFYGAGGGNLAQELADKSIIGDRSIVEDLSGRAQHISTAWAIAKDYPFFGSGGWGCDGLADLYIPEDKLRSWMVGGRVNVHCDPAQFLAEFGIAGGLNMGMVVVVLALGVITAKRNVLWYWISGGLVAVILHSFIDLPFRCPAILLAWCCLFAALPRLTPTLAVDLEKK